MWTDGMLMPSMALEMNAGKERKKSANLLDLFMFFSNLVSFWQLIMSLQDGFPYSKNC
jgi:hypothetical protein